MPVLGQLKLLGYCALGLLVAALIVALSLERRHSRKLTERNAFLVSELQRITTAKDEQRKETVRTIVVAEKGNRDAERRARVVESAPLEGQCKTPAEIMGSDI